jgi:MraZ protein
MRGSAPARIDDKGRLKVPAPFRVDIQERQGSDVFVTSVTGECVRIYPLPAWLDVERKLSAAPGNHPTALKFIDRVNYWGVHGELDSQGRIVIPPQLREAAGIVGEVRVFGRISYIEIWNEERFMRKLNSSPWTDEDGMRLAELGV